MNMSYRGYMGLYRGYMGLYRGYIGLYIGVEYDYELLRLLDHPDASAKKVWCTGSERCLLPRQAANKVTDIVPYCSVRAHCDCSLFLTTQRRDAQTPTIEAELHFAERRQLYHSRKQANRAVQKFRKS